MSEHLDLLDPWQYLVDLAVNLGEHAVNNQVLELLFALYVAVQGAGDHPETRGQGAHGQRFDTLLGNQRECLGHHALPGECAADLLIGFRGVEPQRAGRCGVAPGRRAHLWLSHPTSPSASKLTVNSVHVTLNIAARQVNALRTAGVLRLSRAAEQLKQGKSRWPS